MRVAKEHIKIHMSSDRGGPWCQVQGALYQPPKTTIYWDLVTCQRCKDKREGTGAWASRKEPQHVVARD